MEGNPGIPPTQGGSEDKTPNPNSNNTESQGKTSASSEVVSVKVIPSSNYALKGIANDMHVLFQIVSGDLSQDEKDKSQRPIALSIVLDRSGSMSGSRLEQSKEAIRQIIEGLSPKDRIHFVVYDDKIETVFENQSTSNRGQLLSQLAAVVAGGSTNLGDGLLRGKELLLKHFDPTYIHCMYLFSDGQANHGAYQTCETVFPLVDVALAKGITTCSFGIGDGFNELLMKGIAKHGEGFFYFIQNANQIEFYVSAAFESLKGVIGKNAVLQVRGKNGGVVKRIFPNEDLMVGAKVRDITPNNSKNVLVQLSVSPNASLEQEEVLWYELSYAARSGSAVQKISGTLTLKYTDQADVVLANQNAEPKVAFAIQRSGEINDEITELLRRDRIDEAIAKKKEELEILRQVVEIDKENRVPSFIQKAETGLQSLQQKKEQNIFNYETEIRGFTFTSEQAMYDDFSYGQM